MIKHLFTLLLSCFLVIPQISIAQKTILLENRTWIPESINTRTQIEYKSGELLAGFAYRLMQFESIPSAEIHDQITDYGIELLEYIPNNSYLVSLSTNVKIEDLKRLGVIALEEIRPEYKMSRDIVLGDIGDWALDGNLTYITLKYWKGSSVNELLSELTLAQVSVSEIYTDYRIIEATTDINNLYNLAELSAVEYVSLISPPGEPEDVPGKSLHRANRINSSSDIGLKYNAEGVGILVRDDGVVGPHIDFKGRLDNLETAGFVNIEHADGVAGIMGGAGNLNPTNQGMASGADVYVVNYRANFLDNTLDLHKEKDVMVTNSSYSNGCNDGYTTITQTVDKQIEDNPTFLHVFSAGNSGTLDCGYGAGNRWGNVTGGHKIGKNVIATANLRLDISLENSSSRGPASDGRLKPDLAARGTNQVSTDPNNLYSAFGGTSAASPGVAGVSAQLYHAYREMNGGNDPQSALIKAALMNTANDLGNTGPDYQFGWGHINAWRAYQLLKDKRYLSAEIGNGQTNEHDVLVPDGTTELRVMLYWKEPAASPSARQALVNDLDLTVEDQNGKVYMPWLLDPTPNATTLALPASNGRDSLNNVEQVFFTMPEAGTYTVKVNGTSLPFGSREYFVLYEMKDNNVEITYPVGGEGFAPNEAEQIHWDASAGTESFKLEYSTNDGASWIEMGNASGSQRAFSWSVPTEVSSKCKIRITRGGESTENTIPFSIVGVPIGLRVIKVCPEVVALNWGSVEGADAYDVYILGERFMEIAGESDTNYIELAVPDVLEDMWFAVRAKGMDGLIGRRSIAANYSSGLNKCEAAVDLSLERVLSPNENLVYSCGDFDEAISIEVKNKGKVTIDEFIVNYQLDGSAVSSATVNSSLSPGEIKVIDLMDNLSISSAGLHDVSIWIELAQDELIGNDRKDQQIDVRPLASSASLDFKEDFETGVFPPDQWTVESDVPVVGWERNQVTGSNGSFTRCMGIGSDESIEIFYEDAIYTQAIDLKNATSPAIFFDYAFNLANGSNYPGSIKVVVYSFCGQRSVVELYSRSGAGLNTAPGVNAFPWAPSNADHWRKIAFDLTKFAGSEIVVAFIVENGLNYNFYVDNINVAESNIKFPTSDFTISNTTPCALFETVDVVSVDDDPDFEYNFVFGEFANPKTATGPGPHKIRFLRKGEFNVSLEVTDPTTGAFIAKSIAVEVFSVPSSNFSYDVSNYEVSFENRSSNATSYEWEFGDGETSIEENPTHEYDFPGPYLVKLHATNQCSTRTREIEILVGTVGNRDLESAEVVVFPNPTRGSTTIRHGDIGDGDRSYSIMDLRGIDIQKGELSKLHETNVDISDLSSGLYLVKIMIDGHVKALTRMVVD